MPATTRNLTLMILPQSWDGANLIANILLLPNGDPTIGVPIVTGDELPFATAQPVLRAAVLPGLATPPWAPTTSPEFVPVTLSYSASQSSIFTSLNSEYAPIVPVLKQPTAIIRKDLPDSYREATGFQTPDSAFFTAEDGFGCALAAATPSQAPLTQQPIAWGEVLSYALRQPLVATAMGLMYLSVSIPLTSAQVSAGGWIWIEIDPSESTNWYAQLTAEQPSSVVSYAARLPFLSAAQDVFAALLFPTVPSTVDGATIDAAQYEADLYLDGFAKIVHAAQPTSSDAVTNDPTQIVPGTDAGVQIGWDDEQVTTWVNRQIAIAQAFATGATPLAELPFTILGYRVDVRETPLTPASPQTWSSLCLASGTINAAEAFTTSFSATELCVEPTPVQNGTPALNADFWLPQYFAQWRGRTLVVNDPYAYAFSGGQPPVASFPPATNQFNGTTSEVLSGVSLRYGNSYQFRTRLTDLTGGGPHPTDVSPTDAGITTLNFRRNVPPKQVQLTVGGLDSSGNQKITVDRPLINYPEMVFSGAADQAVLDALLAITPPQQPFGQPLNPNAPPFQAAVLDPDVTTLQIIVEAQAPAHDTGNPCLLADADTSPAPGDLDGTYRVVYTWPISFPVATGPFEPGASTPIQITLQPTPMDSIAHPVLPAPANSTVLPIPTGRNVRIRMRGLGNADPNALYFASSIARTGLITDMTVRYEAATETNVLATGSPDQQLQAFYLRNLDNSAQIQIVADGLAQLTKASFLNPITPILQAIAAPPSTPSQLLSSALGLPLNDLTFSAPPGQRILFGAQSTLRHNVTQDRSSITFSAEKDLINRWIVVHRLTLDRDWTWSGLAQNGAGQIAFNFAGEFPDVGSQTLGKIDLPGVVSALATQSGSGASSSGTDQRDSTELIFFSTIDSNVAPGDFPSPTSVTYQLTATFTGSPSTPVDLWDGNITVPITVQPRQVPQLVSAGIAESPYIAASDYSSTTQRQRALWFEFETKPDDPNDSYFVRVVNYGTDPLLVSQPFDLQPAPDTPIPLDPEPIRTITPDSANDDAGLSAMTQLVASASSPVHFLVPLPEGISPSALDLFGFWTYEIRCGHLQWSTAQGRFGRALRVAGVQHPSPPLTLTVERITNPGGPAFITASANIAQTVLDGQSFTSANAPQTQIWFVLYAQLQRADGQAHRNLLVSTAQGNLPSADFNQIAPGPLGSITVSGSFLESDIDADLAALLLPPNTPLSILAVEFFNLEADVIDYQTDTASVQPEELTFQGHAARQASAEEGSTTGATRRSASPADDTLAYNPLTSELGSRRILRVSPLVPVRATC